MKLIFTLLFMLIAPNAHAETLNFSCLANKYPAEAYVKLDDENQTMTFAAHDVSEAGGKFTFQATFYEYLPASGLVFNTALGINSKGDVGYYTFTYNEAKRQIIQTNNNERKDDLYQPTVWTCNRH